jgi:hypothetical protein
MGTQRNTNRSDPQFQFYESYTSTMMQFAQLEEALARAFCSLFGDKSYLAQSIFYAQQSTGSKHMLVDSAYTAFSSGTVIYELWKRISKRFDKIIEFRNYLAHGEKVFVISTEEQRFCVRTSPYAVIRRLKGKNQEIYVKDMDDARSKSIDVSNNLDALTVIVSKIVSPDFVMLPFLPSYPEAMSQLDSPDLSGIKLNELGCLEKIDVEDALAVLAKAPERSPLPGDEIESSNQSRLHKA